MVSGNLRLLMTPHLPFMIYKAGKDSKWKLRDEIITRMLFQTGARVERLLSLHLVTIVLGMIRVSLPLLIRAATEKEQSI